MNTKSSAPRLGIGGPVGSGKTALIEAIAPLLIEQGYKLALVTNDILTKEDANRLKQSLSLSLDSDRILGVETGACPHTVIREDPSMNLAAVRELEEQHTDIDLIMIESGGDNLAATFSTALVDAYIYVIDVAAGDDIPRKNGPAVCQSDLLVINKLDLAPYVGADLGLMDRDTKVSRKDKPYLFTNCKDGTRIHDVVEWIKQELLFI